MSYQSIYLPPDVEFQTLTETIADDGKEAPGAEVLFALQISQDRIVISLCDPQGREIAAVYVETWCGKVQGRYYPAGPDYADNEGVPFVLAEIKKIGGQDVDGMVSESA